MLEWTSQTIIQSIPNQSAFVEVVHKIGHQRIASAVLHWVRSVIIVACSIILRRYVSKNRIFLKTLSKRINNVEVSETTEQSENQNVYFINFNEHYNSEYSSSDDNYVAMIEHFYTTPVALQNMTITIGKTTVICSLGVFDSGSGCTIINMSIAKQTMFNCIQAQLSKKGHSGGFQPILGRDLFDHLAITISQTLCPKTEENAIETPCLLKQSLAKDFPDLISRIRKYKHHTVNSKFHKIFL